MGVWDEKFPIQRGDTRPDPIGPKRRDAIDRVRIRQEAMRSRDRFYKRLGLTPRQWRTTSYGMAERKRGR